jgi:hypothetical protein
MRSSFLSETRIAKAFYDVVGQEERALNGEKV